MLLQVSNPGGMNLFTLSSLLWVIVIITVVITALAYFIKHYSKTFLWAHQVIHPLQDGLNRWNRQFNDWLHHYKPVNFFVRTGNGENRSFTAKELHHDSFAEELIETAFDNTNKEEKADFSAAENNLLRKEISLLKEALFAKEGQEVSMLKRINELSRELHTAKAYNEQLLHEIGELQQFRANNKLLQGKMISLQNELNDVSGKWMTASDTIERLTSDINQLNTVEKELIDAMNYTKDLEQQVEKITILESEIKSLEAEREWLLVQVQEIKTKQHNEYAHLQSSYKTIQEERNLLQNKIVLLESEVGALSRALNNNKQKQSEDALWENKFIVAARELEDMRRNYASMENELAALRNKEQLLREKAKLANGLQSTLLLRQGDLEILQRQLYECRNNR